MADAKMLNRDKAMAKLAQVPQFVQDAVAYQLEDEVNGLVEADKRAAPVDPTSEDPGNFQRSIHAYENPDRPLSWRIIVDAKDKRGAFIATSVEQGHKAADGTQVPGRPSFFPTYRARKPGIRRRLAAAARKAAKVMFPG